LINFIEDKRNLEVVVGFLQNTQKQETMFVTTEILKGVYKVDQKIGVEDTGNSCSKLGYSYYTKSTQDGDTEDLLYKQRLIDIYIHILKSKGKGYQSFVVSLYLKPNIR